MVSKLDLYILNSDNSVAPFPSEAEQIVLYDFAFEAQRMGSAPEITATIQASGSLENALTTKVFCEYKGERYYLKNLPESSKDNTDPRYTIDLTFVSERTILDNVYMIDAVQGDGNIDRYQSNSTIIVFTGTIEEFVSRLNASMAYTGVGYSVVLDEGIATESKLVSFQDKVFTEALQEGVKIFNVPYYYVGKVIHVGWSESTIPTLKYGDGLLSINKSLRTERIINRATATGSSENIPYYYPNPTPNGYITPVINSRSGAEISVVNEAKLGKLATNSKLRYCEFETPLQVQGIYSSVSSLVANVDVAGTPILSTDGYVLIQKQSLTFVYIKVSWSSVTGGVDDFMIQYKAYIGDNKTKVRNIGVYAYTLEKRNSNIGKVDVAVLDASISAQIVGDYIVINSLPANQERYIGIVYSNDTNSYYGSVFYASPETVLNDGWYIYNGDTRVEDRPVNIAQYGVLVKGTPTEGDEVSYSVTKKIPFATTLMPPIYRNSGGEHRFYNAINGAYEGVIFENEYSEVNPKETITKFEDIKPTIVGVTNANGERIDMFTEFAYDLSDSDETEQTDKNSESFIHPYFYAKLRKIDGDNGFNLFTQAIESGEMTIEMTSGHCGACKFVIAVDENTQRNLVMVDATGNLIYDDATGKVKMASDAMGLDRQNDTQNYEVWIALKKDINTYGQVMPIANSTIKPSADDTFVITNILLPQAYFTAAEKKLEEEIISFIVKNNSFQFDYGINFSRIFLKKRKDVFFTLSENVLIPIEYNGKLLSFYVASYSYRKQKGELLPEISVSLTDNFESTPSGIEQVINAAQESIIKSGEPSGLTLGYTDERYVRKDAPDTVKERIAFDKGLDFKGSLTSRDFRRGYFAGAGFGVYTDDNGDAIIEADKLVIRKDLEVNNLVINQVSYVGGMQITSAASLEINRVIENDNAYQCFFDQKGGSVANLFQVNDIAYSQRFDEENNTTKYYKRVVIAVDIDSITLSKSQADGEGVPMANDVVIQYGNTTDTNRQYVIIRDVIGGGYERMLSDLNSVSATGVEYYFAGRMDGDTPRWFVGNNEQFIEYKDGHLQINADVTLGSGSDLSASEEYKKLQDDIKGLQNQIDGKVEAFYFDYDPSNDTYPTNEWTTDKLKEEHLNDTFTNIESGQSWRWLLKDGVYQWVAISDTQALQMAQDALNIANSKVTIFTEIPTPPYKVKDLWFQGEGGNTKRCIKARTEQETYNADDWVNADDYKAFASSVASDAENNAKAEIGTFDYLKQAMAQNTTLSGGLVQTTLLQLGYRVGDNLIVQSGTNGIYNSDLKGGGIASWWGGDMLDKEVEGVTGRVAQALLRMDGTGYLAGGNITWDLYGAGSVAGGNLSWDKDGNITLSDNIRISSDKDETLGAVLTSISKLQSSLTSFKSLFDSMFEKDSEGNIHAKLSLWSSGGITAGGVGSGGSGGGGISYNRLDSWSDYSADKAGYVLSALLGKDLDNRVSALTNAGYITASYLAPYALRSEIPSLDGYFLASNFNQANLKSTLGISDWALASAKPTYTASEVGALSVNGGDIGGSLNFRNGSSITCANGIVLEMYAGVDTYLRGSSNIYISAPNVYTQRNVYIYKVLDSGNYSDYALPKTGGTLTGTTSIPLYIKSSHATEAAVGFGANNAKGYGYIVYKGGDSWAVTKEQWGAEYSILHTGNYSNLLAGGTVNGSITATSFIGTLTGNADSATKLATPRTIWGQKFDGTGNVSGDLMLGDGTMYVSNRSNLSNPIIIQDAVAVSFGYGNISLNLTTFIDGHSIKFRSAGYRTPMVIDSSGNVTIGGATADEKLHVHGNGKFTGALTVNSLTIGGVTLTYDSVNEALCVNGNMYALGGITAGGAGISAYTSLESRVARLEQQLNIS